MTLDKVHDDVQLSPTHHFRNQPRGFWNLALTELWERFSFYGLQGILTYYLLYSLNDGGLAMSPTTAVSVVGAYGASVYLAQVLGGWVSDHLIPPRTAVLVGAVLIATGHVSLAVLSGGVGLSIGLGLIALGTGALKTNISSIIGIMLADRDRQLSDASFSLFYLAINIGAVLGPLLTGLLQSRVGFHYAFGLAAFGMVIALAQYLRGFSQLPAESRVVMAPITAGRTASALGITVLLALLAALLWGTGVVTGANLNRVMGLVIVSVVTAYFVVILRSGKITIDERRRVGGYVPMWLAETFYYGLYLQIFTTIPLLIADRVQLDVHGWSIPEAWFSMIGSLALMLFIPVMAGPWRDRHVGRLQPPYKFAAGIAILSMAYLLMLLTELSAPGRTVSPLLIGACLVIAGVSEVFVGPVGFTVVTRLAPDGFKTQLVAVKILTLGAGSTLSGFFGALYTGMSATPFFLLVGGAGLVAAAALLLGARRLDAATRL